MACEELDKLKNPPETLPQANNSAGSGPGHSASAAAGPAGEAKLIAGGDSSVAMEMDELDPAQEEATQLTDRALDKALGLLSQMLKQSRAR